MRAFKSTVIVDPTVDNEGNACPTPNDSSSNTTMRGSSMTDVIFTNSVARGRNGWFKMAAASISVCSGRVIANIVSKREVVPGPVFLELDPEDAVALGRELLRQACQEPQSPKKASERA
jgi:hypothetical protein